MGLALAVYQEANTWSLDENSKDYSLCQVDVVFADSPFSVTFENILLVDATDGAVSIVLPVPDQLTNQRVNIKKVDSSSNAVTITATDSSTIDGQANYVLNVQNDSVQIVTDTDAYYISNSHLFTSGKLPDNNVLWDDIRVPALATRIGGVAPPNFIQFKDDGAASTGVFAYEFIDGFLKQVFFTAQIPHGYKEGTDLHAHVHFVPATNIANGDTVIWGLEYTWQNVSGDFSDTSTTTGTYTGTDEDVVDKHIKLDMGDITGTGKKISSMLVCRLYRDGATDTSTAHMFLLEFDFHFQINSLGSENESSKGF
jgi:hypothetical protein